MPAACTNCIRFHYGECRERVKQCFECKGYNHIERYCPNRKNQIRRVAGEPLAGTRAWIEMHGLQHDPELKKRVLNALKTNPGSAIFVNEICIYVGTEKHFDVEDRPSRGRTLEERIKRDRERSRSPPRYRQPSPRVHSGRSPSRERGRPGYNGSPRRKPRYRSRSPLKQRRRTPSPYQLPAHAPGRQPDYRPRSPRYAENSNAVVFEARERDRYEDNRAENRATRAAPFKFNLPPAQPDYRKPDLFNTGSPRANLQQNSGDVFKDRGPLQTRDTNSQALQGVVKEPQPQSQARVFQASKMTQPQTSSTPQSSSQINSDFVEDPHFVLGITKGASRDEIMDAYQQRMAEVEEERRVDEGFNERMPAHVWEESISILIAAKRQLLGGP
ncbi:hypothetical protein ONS95_001468 [Cadophora gregata]|uniref:uncharacterized protein n=1 Tax=Cadophora gregata TaxID=51156 RepID=UPI0026DCFF5E|nr:uncharacterized protein ONS95_001468 [Cadophora gregata]KAK0111090.1 hypothetical protein ONS95_001468 [Cadophora gregata]KAK0112447.1 hypothetical protein ONS96_001686 [Cadophora gregata f. sp. sojae]